MSKKNSWLSFSLILYLGMNTAKTLAHGSYVDYQVTSAVEIKAKFDNGKPMSKAQVIIYAPNNLSQPWSKGMTDVNGTFVFAPDDQISGQWTVKISSAGHGNVINIPIESKLTNKKTTLENVEVEPDNEEKGKVSQSLAETNQNITLADSRTIASHNIQLQPTILQKLVMAATGVWGFIGTALFFSRKKKGLN